MSTKDVIATNLRTLRKVRGLSQPELAARVGISPRTIARLEAGQVADPSINHVRDLARALGVTVDLISESELEPLTIAVPAKLRQVLDTPEGLELLSELLDFERVRGRQAVLAAMRQMQVDARASTREPEVDARGPTRESGSAGRERGSDVRGQASEQAHGDVHADDGARAPEQELAAGEHELAAHERDYEREGA